MYTIDELKNRAQVYFEKNDEILATDDGQFFYNTPDGRVYARNYVFRKKVKTYLIKKDGEVLSDSDIKAAEKKVAEKQAKTTVKNQKKTEDDAKKAKEAEKDLVNKKKEADKAKDVTAKPKDQTKV